MEGFIHFFWNKNNIMEISYFFVEISYGDLLWGSYSDMTWDILGFGYFKMTWDIVSDMMGIRLEI